MKGTSKSYFVVGICAVFSLIGMLSLGALATEVTAAEKVFHWKFSNHVSPGNKAAAPSLLWWAEQVEKRSNGRIKVKMYWIDELCGPKEMMMAVKSGLADVVTQTPAYTPGETPIWNAVYLPFLAPARLDHMSVIYNRLAQESKPFMDEINKFNCVYIGCYNSEGYASFMGNKPVRRADDFKGLRVRVMPDQGVILKKFGAIPMTVPVTEMYSALDTGIVDLVSHSRLSFHSHKIDEISKYLIQGMDMGAMGMLYLINKDRWNELPDELKKMVHDLMYDLPAWMWNYENKGKWIEEFHEVIRTRGIEVIDFPKSEREKIKAKSGEVWEAYAKRTGVYENAKRAIADYIRIRDEVVAKYPQGVPGIKYK
jgi:TRAP-type C4-dicarboxylate transport system substrate-binding protein